MKPILICASFVAGFPFRGLDPNSIAEGETVTLEPEPSNPHDPNAIKVIQDSTGACIGYVPREATQAIREALEAGATLTAVIVEKLPTKWKEFTMHIRATFPNA